MGNSHIQIRQQSVRDLLLAVADDINQLCAVPSIKDNIQNNGRNYHCNSRIQCGIDIRNTNPEMDTMHTSVIKTKLLSLNGEISVGDI